MVAEGEAVGRGGALRGTKPTGRVIEKALVGVMAKSTLKLRAPGLVLKS
jgi:hypothetical protein